MKNLMQKLGVAFILLMIISGFGMMIMDIRDNHKRHAQRVIQCNENDSVLTRHDDYNRWMCIRPGPNGEIQVVKIFNK